MPKRTYSMSEIYEVITDLPEQFDQDPTPVAVIQDGKSVMTILPTSSYKVLIETLESLLETIEVVKDKELMAAFRQDVKDMEEGRVELLDDTLKEPGWE